MPAVDRTDELLVLFEGVAPKTKQPAADQVRSRHRRERFAVEDHRSPGLHRSDSGDERQTPPATFISEATSIVQS